MITTHGQDMEGEVRGFPKGTTVAFASAKTLEDAKLLAYGEEFARVDLRDEKDGIYQLMQKYYRKVF